MALKIYKNSETGEEKRTFKKLSSPWEEQIVAPSVKFMEPANKATGTSRLRDSKKMLTERARNHSRNTLIDDNIQVNKANGLDGAVARNLLNENGTRRRKIDDI